MKHVWKLMLLMVVLGGRAWSQGCAPAPAWPQPGQTPSILSLIVGSYDQVSLHGWGEHAQQVQDPVAVMRSYLMGGSWQAAQMKAEAQLQDSSAAPEILEIAGLTALALDQLPKAEAYLQRGAATPGEMACRLRVEKLLVSYLIRFGSTAPILPHFNSGFFNYLQDSLQWRSGNPDPQGYVTALDVVGLLYRMDHNRSAVYMEMLGDLLSKEPDRFNANYVAALAYLRAGIHAPDAAAVYDTKAIHALEWPRDDASRFNQYRFTQLRKALVMDVDSAKTAGAESFSQFPGPLSTAPLSVAIGPDDKGQLPAILTKAKTQQTARAAEAKRYAGDVDLQKEVKSDSRFNAFALFLIGSIIAAVVVIWRKLRKASQT